VYFQCFSYSTVAAAPADIKSHDDMSEQLKMSSNTHPRKPITLYCSRPTQTQDDSEAEESDFPPFLEGSLSPIMSRPSPVRPRSRYLPAATSGSQQQLTISGATGSGKEQHRRLPNAGLGQTNVVNTVTTANTKVSNSIHFLM
jgi:hypothetical protein